MLDPRNVVPFYELPVYRTSGNLALPATPNYGQASATGTIAEEEKKTLKAAKLQHSGIPEKLFIFIRLRLSDLRCNDTDSYATIKT